MPINNVNNAKMLHFYTINLSKTAISHYKLFIRNYWKGLAFRLNPKGLLRNCFQNSKAISVEKSEL